MPPSLTHAPWDHLPRRLPAPEHENLGFQGSQAKTNVKERHDKEVWGGHGLKRVFGFWFVFFLRC